MQRITEKEIVMEYTGYKLVFSTSVHFGNGSLENSDNRIYADTIFSALCHEAVKLECIEELVSYVKNEKDKNCLMHFLLSEIVTTFLNQ